MGRSSSAAWRPLTKVAVLLGVMAKAQEKMPDPCDEGALTFIDHSAWADVLRDSVRPGTKYGINTTFVNYTQIRMDQSRMRTYMRQLCNVDLESMPVLDRLALLANAYNVLMVAMIIHYDPPNSVRDISGMVSTGDVWTEKLWTLAGNKVSLDDIEHNLIRGRGVFPVENRLAVQGGVSGRIHSTIVCGSLSCPSLLDVPWEGSSLAQLSTEATRRWLLNPTKNPGPVEGRAEVRLSMIFSWFTEDFVIESNSVEGFVRNFAGWSMEQVPDNSEISYETYRWELNSLNASANPLSDSTSMASAPTFSLVTTAVLVLLVALRTESRSCSLC